jgi:hypothetical protein
VKLDATKITDIRKWEVWERGRNVLMLHAKTRKHNTYPNSQEILHWLQKYELKVHYLMIYPHLQYFNIHFNINAPSTPKYLKSVFL